MLIVGPGNRGTVTATGGARRTPGAGAGFRLAEAPAAAEPAPSVAAAPTPSLDALLMVQEADPRERRRRAIDNRRRALDVLDEVKLALIAGTSPGPALQRLEQAAAALREATGEPGLDAVLGEIDLRVAVELAKHGRIVHR